MESTPRDIYLRFFSLMKQFPHMMAARLSQIDYSREMAFVAIAPPGSADAGDILGVARMIADPNNERAEFAVMVRSDWHGRGPRLQADADANHLRRSPRHRHALWRCAPREHHHASDGARARLQSRDNRYAPIVPRRAKPPRGRSSTVVNPHPSSRRLAVPLDAPG